MSNHDLKKSHSEEELNELIQSEEGLHTLAKENDISFDSLMGALRKHSGKITVAVLLSALFACKKTEYETRYEPYVPPVDTTKKPPVDTTGTNPPKPPKDTTYVTPGFDTVVVKGGDTTIKKFDKYAKTPLLSLGSFAEYYADPQIDPAKTASIMNNLKKLQGVAIEGAYYGPGSLPNGRVRINITGVNPNSSADTILIQRLAKIPNAYLMENGAKVKSTDGLEMINHGNAAARNVVLEYVKEAIQNSNGVFLTGISAATYLHNQQPTNAPRSANFNGVLTLVDAISKQATRGKDNTIGDCSLPNDDKNGPKVMEVVGKAIAAMGGGSIGSRVIKDFPIDEANMVAATVAANRDMNFRVTHVSKAGGGEKTDQELVNYYIKMAHSVSRATGKKTTIELFIARDLNLTSAEDIAKTVADQRIVLNNKTEAFPTHKLTEPLEIPGYTPNPETQVYAVEHQSRTKENPEQQIG